MAIWLSLLIPLATGVILHYACRHRIVWWELAVPFLLSLLLVLLAKWMIVRCQTNDTEYWTSWAERVEYWEEWSELVVKTRTVSDGKTSRVEVYTEVENHPPEWYVIDAGGHKHYTTPSYFEHVSIIFGSREFRKVNRIGAIIRSGGVYVSHWPKTEQTMVVVNTAHTYTNKVQAAPSVFNHRKIGEEEKAQYGLFDYPKVSGLHQRSVLGWDDPVTERMLSVANAKQGASHQIRTWLLVYRNQPMEAAVAQENYWQGGNKNELVLCVGIDNSNTVQWGYVFSWTERETFKAEVRTCIEGQLSKPFNGPQLVADATALVPSGWQRKSFKDFDYLTVEPPVWSIVLVFCLVLAVSVVSGLWAVYNEHTVSGAGGVQVWEVIVGVVTFTTVLTTLFLGLKVGGLLQWSWWWVLFPTLLTVAVALCVAAFVGFVYWNEKN